MTKTIVLAALTGGLFSLTACTEFSPAPDPAVSSTVDQAVQIPAAVDAKGKITIPVIYRLGLMSLGENGSSKYLWVNVDNRTFAACPRNAGWPGCKKGIDGIE